MDKLISSIPSNSVKLIEIYNKITSGMLITGPDFQRKLVWKKQHKFAFIETILLNYPFPEVYIASIEVDVETLKASEVVVDGQQRLTTIVDYIKGDGEFTNQNYITPFDDLTIDEKKDFLNYSITVKDLNNIGEEKIKDVFKRINSTNYSLNSNEILNAEFGGGEFAIFSKALVDEKEELTKFKTDIRIAENDRLKIVKFFNENDIFTDNDVKRMFDAQFIMLIAATFLEGNYFSRNIKIEYYLEKYNNFFDDYEFVVSKLKNSIQIITSLNLSVRSYWLNKPNLFTLLFELSNIKLDDINLELFEIKLIELEQKMDLYFNANLDTEISNITDEERKYFEFARQGSHELPSRQHRGKLISRLITESKKVSNPITVSPSIAGIDDDHAIIIPTETGLKKSIMDATSNVREFLKAKGLHIYESQYWGPEYKIIVNGKFVSEAGEQDTKISLYRSKGRGDYRIWFKDLGNFARANDELALTVRGGVIHITNLSQQ